MSSAFRDSSGLPAASAASPYAIEPIEAFRPTSSRHDHIPRQANSISSREVVEPERYYHAVQGPPSPPNGTIHSGHHAAYSSHQNDHISHHALNPSSTSPFSTPLASYSTQQDISTVVPALSYSSEQPSFPVLPPISAQSRDTFDPTSSLLNHPSVFNQGLTSSLPSVDPLRGYGQSLVSYSRPAYHLHASTSSIPRTIHRSLALPHGKYYSWRGPHGLMDPSYGEEGTMTPPLGDQSELPWPRVVDVAEGGLTTSSGIPVQPEILCRMEKGFEWLQGHWIGYRRNYFAVSCAFTLSPPSPNTRLHLHGRKVQAFAMKLSAAVDDQHYHPGHLHTRSIELVQFTAKRDNGAKKNVTWTRIAPGMPLRPGSTATDHRYSQFSRNSSYGAQYATTPYLPYQTTAEEAVDEELNRQRYSPEHPPLVDHGGDTICKQHCFDRIQFKSATANNGKRRATQQFYHVRTELWADVRNDGADEPSWVLIMTKISAPVVVRGRSPNHYKDEDADDDDSGDGGPGPSRGGQKRRRRSRPPGPPHDDDYDGYPDPSRDEGRLINDYGTSSSSSTGPWRPYPSYAERDVKRRRISGPSASLRNLSDSSSSSSSSATTIKEEPTSLLDDTHPLPPPVWPEYTWYPPAPAVDDYLPPLHQDDWLAGLGVEAPRSLPAVPSAFGEYGGPVADSGFGAVTTAAPYFVPGSVAGFE